MKDIPKDMQDKINKIYEEHKDIKLNPCDRDWETYI